MKKKGPFSYHFIFSTGCVELANHNMLRTWRSLGKAGNFKVCARIQGQGVREVRVSRLKIVGFPYGDAQFFSPNSNIGFRIRAWFYFRVNGLIAKTVQRSDLLAGEIDRRSLPTSPSIDFGE
jgi:hypothetical protein